MRKYCHDIQIIANTFEYKNDMACKYHEPLIHILNKQEMVYHHIKQVKPNVIVMGDIIEDV